MNTSAILTKNSGQRASTTIDMLGAFQVRLGYFSVLNIVDIIQTRAKTAAVPGNQHNPHTYKIYYTALDTGHRVICQFFYN